MRETMKMSTQSFQAIPVQMAMSDLVAYPLAPGQQLVTVDLQRMR
jgi:hypothetical protein